jgi:Protein of unknown function (DUF3617)
MNLRPALAVGLAVCLSVPALAQIRRDGRWEVKVVTDGPGIPAGMPPATTIQCITPVDATDPQKTMPPGGRGAAGDCKVSDYKTVGHKVSWSLTCEGARPMTGTAVFVYDGDAFAGVMKMNRGGQSMAMKYTGKRIDDCVK